MFEDDEEEEYDPKKEQQKLEATPFYQKAMEIVELVNQISATLPDDDELYSDYGLFMREDSYLILVKFSSAQKAPYDIKMENAAIIRKSAREILTHTAGLKMMGYKDVQYLQLLRNAIEELRLLFIDWIESFDPWDYHIDRWGLFNPPGVGPHDKDLDDNIPFNPENLDF